ncbi:MAG TPA: putative N-acetylmannosamine-6-phosphate 2-epimerase [Alloacidobacterium sp.]|nr:putative N-acetylmannosamine-6-phosphate 2-epimerase [Alloacidobacterium sp.]
MTDALFPASLKGRLIVSCQAPPGDPLNDVETLTRIAISVLRGGAGGLRANGADCVAAFRRETVLPILGIQKQKLGNSVSITPDFAAAKAIAEAGADAIALDCSTARNADAEPWPQMITRIHNELGKPVLADIATFEEAVAAEDCGADAVATTLYGFTPDTAGAGSVNWEMVENLARELHVPLIVEGYVSQPEEVRRALDLGAFAVVVGSAITRPESITARFVEASR